jgi:chromosome segregation ATPase
MHLESCKGSTGAFGGGPFSPTPKNLQARRPIHGNADEPGAAPQPAEAEDVAMASTDDRLTMVETRPDGQDGRLDEKEAKAAEGSLDSRMSSFEGRQTDTEAALRAVTGSLGGVLKGFEGIEKGQIVTNTKLDDIAKMLGDEFRLHQTATDERFVTVLTDLKVVGKGLKGIEKRQTAMDNRFVTVLTDLKVVGKGLKGIEKRQTAMDAKVDGLQAGFKTQQTAMDAMDAKVDGLQAGFKTQQTAMVAMAAKVDGLQADMADLKTQQAAMAAKQDAFQADVADLRKRQSNSLKTMLAILTLMVGLCGLLVSLFSHIDNRIADAQTKLTTIVVEAIKSNVPQREAPVEELRKAPGDIVPKGEAGRQVREQSPGPPKSAAP